MKIIIFVTNFKHCIAFSLCEIKFNAFECITNIVSKLLHNKNLHFYDLLLTWHLFAIDHDVSQNSGIEDLALSPIEFSGNAFST